LGAIVRLSIKGVSLHLAAQRSRPTHTATSPFTDPDERLTVCETALFTLPLLIRKHLT